MLKDKLQVFIDRYNEITNELSSPEIASNIKKMTELSKEQSELEPLIRRSRVYSIDEGLLKIKRCKG